MIPRLLAIFSATSILVGAAPFPSSQLFGADELREMSWVVENAPTHPVVHSVMHDFGSGSLRYARISQNFATINFEYFGSSQSPPGSSQPESYTSIARGEDGGLAVAYTAFESLPVPAYHLYLAKKPAGGAWSIQKLQEFVNINRIQLALRNDDIDEWRIAYSDPALGEIRILSSLGSNHKVCDLVTPALEVGFDITYVGATGLIAFHDSIRQKLCFEYLIDLASGTWSGNPGDIDSGPGVGLDVRFGRNNAAGQFGNHYLTYRDGGRNEIKMSKFELRDQVEIWTPETVAKGNVHILRRPTIALNTRGEPIIAYYRESWNDLNFKQRLQGRWYGGRHAAGTGSAHVPSLAIVPDYAGAFSVLAENLSDSARSMIRVGPVEDFTDADGDGVPLYFERAFAMNSAVMDSHLLPKMDLAGGELVYGVRKVNGGTFSNDSSQYLTADWRILIEISEDLENWSSSTNAVKRVDTFSVNNLRVSTYAPVNPQQKKAFFRTQVERR